MSPKLSPSFARAHYFELNQPIRHARASGRISRYAPQPQMTRTRN